MHSVYLMLLDIIKLRENQFDTMLTQIRNEPNNRPFSIYIYAIDGTYIPATIPKDDRE